MAISSLFHSATALVGVCTKRVSSAGRKLLSHAKPSNSKPAGKRWPALSVLGRGASCLIPFLWMKQMKCMDMSENERGEEEEGGVWRRSILMGEKCQPLDFSGVIYYDCDGKLVQELPAPPRTPFRSPLQSFAFRREIAV